MIKLVVESTQQFEEEEEEEDPFISYHKPPSNLNYYTNVKKLHHTCGLS